MDLIVIAPKNILNESMWKDIYNNYKNITFLNANELMSFNFNLSSEEKVILADPDWVDWNFPNEILRKTNKLKAVCLTTTTASYIDEEFLKNQKIQLLTVPKYSTDSVAEYLVFFMMCLAKKLPLQLKNNLKQDFVNDLLQIELTGKTVGVVGFGNIGKRVCEITKGMGMNPIYYNRSPKQSEFKSVSLEELFKVSDVIIVTLANNSETRKLITDEMLLSMKNTAIFISGTGTALHSDKVIREMLEANKLFGFGAEIAGKSHNDYPGNVMLTGEYAWFTYEAFKRREEIVYQNLLTIKTQK